MPQLTFTRFIAAILIVLFHFGKDTALFNNPAISPLIKLAPAGVSYFFLLSGFILSSVYYKEAEHINKKQYYLKRFARIYPVFFLALIILMVFLFFTKGVISIDAFFLHILLLQAWFPNFIQTLNYPSWSLSVELFFYLLFPFILPKLKQIKRKWLLALLSLGFWFVSLIIYGYGLNSGLFINFYNYNPLLHLNSFIMGMAGYLMFQEFKESISARKSLICVVFPLLVLALLLIFHAPILHYHNNGLLAPLFAIFLIGLASDKSSISKFLSLKPFIILGEISYSIYILQVPLYVWWNAFFTRYLSAYQNLQLPTFIILLIGFSWISFKFVEEPARQALKKIIL